MSRVRWLATTFALPLAYLAAVVLATRTPKAVHVFANPTVMTVTDSGPAVLHAPPAVYPPQAWRDGVEGKVRLKVIIAADGTVARATPFFGPKPLRQAAAGNVRQWQFEAMAGDWPMEVEFSLSRATHSLALPEPALRTAPRYNGMAHGRVRVVATVDVSGRVEFVQPVTGPEELVPAAVETVRHWTFRPMLRNGTPERGTAVVDVPFGQ
jgi:outer membrane biosynthesis protein TonB